MRKIHFTILSRPWTLRVLKKKKYKRKNGADSLGITDADKRRIDLRGDDSSLETVIHELVHAYMAELCVSSVDLDSDQTEEVFAELLSKFGFDLLNQADELWVQVKQGGRDEQSKAI